MDLTRSTPAAAKAAQTVPQAESNVRSDLRSDVRSDVRAGVRSDLRNSVRSGADGRQKSSGFGMPCSNCRLYYPANLEACPACNSKERVSPSVVPAIPKVQTAAEPSPDTAVVEQEREAFLKEFKSQLFAAHAEVANSPEVCALAEHHAQGAEAASICKACYDRAAGARGCSAKRPCTWT